MPRAARPGEDRWMMMAESRVGGTRITLQQGDITEQDVAAIVNAANSTLLGGGGVDGAIHRRGGAGILEECRELRRTTWPDGVPSGHAVSTTAGRLPAHRVIHTVGPVWHGGGKGERDVLAAAYRACLDVARDERLRSIAFPSISTGAYGFPIELAAPIALATVAAGVRAAPGAFDEIRFVLFSGTDFAIYEAALAEVGRA
jgi:O-acetyl-ADP-ribose deacetylase